MIRLSEDGKSIVEIHTYEELLERPGFKEKLDLSQHKLSKILGPYSLPTKAPCGLSSCRTQHNKGYLVVVEGGLEINIGHLCGKKMFGIDWGIQKQAHKALVNQARYRDQLIATQHRLTTIRNSSDALILGDEGAKSLLKRVSYWLDSGFDTVTSSSLLARAKRGNSSVTKIVQLSDRESEIAEIHQNNSNKPAPTNSNAPKSKEDILFVIRGLSIVKNRPKLKKLVYRTFGEQLNFFSQVDIDTLKPDELRHWNNWAKNLESDLEELKILRSECERFLSQENIAQINRSKSLIQKVA